ncbi:tumor protein p53-inducible protein 11-like isoform X3 [Apostichopus japonicus]
MAHLVMWNSSEKQQNDDDTPAPLVKRKTADKAVQATFLFRQGSGARIIPPLRKQSSGDLQSRLKTRKLLGVGECEDGSVPLSKISQILGTDDNYLQIFPVGLRLWQVTTSVVFSAVAILAIFFPLSLFDVLFNTRCGDDSILPIRLFGAALACVALHSWSSTRSLSRTFIQLQLLSESFYLAMLFLVVVITLWGRGLFSFPIILVIALIIMSFMISFYFHSVMSGRVRSLMRARSTVENCAGGKAE